VNYCKETKAVATAYCPEVTEKVLVLETERDMETYRKHYVSIDDNKYLFRPDPNKVCTVHNEFWYQETTAPEVTTEPEEDTETEELTETEEETETETEAEIIVNTE
jgi:hypothetical protein